MRGFRAAVAAVSLSAAMTGASVSLAGPASAACEGGYPPAQCTVAISDSRVVVGQELSFTATGYRAGERATATVFSTPVVVGTYTASSSGVVSGTFTVPRLSPGRHTLQVAGATSTVIKTARFVVVPNEAAAGATAANSGSSSTALPFTGSDVAKTAGLGGLLLLGGGALVMAAKRRRQVNAAL